MENFEDEMAKPQVLPEVVVEVAPESHSSKRRREALAKEKPVEVVEQPAEVVEEQPAEVVEEQPAPQE